MDRISMFTANFSSWLKAGSALRGFGSDDKASAAPIAALCAIPLVMIAGVAIDSSRLSSARVTVQAATDAAALAAAAAYGAGNNDYEIIADASFDQTYPATRSWRLPIWRRMSRSIAKTIRSP
jgi:Flp pilus assembly protein TadG